MRYLGLIILLCNIFRPMKCFFKDVPSSASNIIKVGVILPYKGDHQWVIQAAFPSIQLAAQRIEDAADILPGYKFELNMADSACSETFGPLAAINMHINQSANVFLGPVCDYAIAPIARFSYYWGIPVLTAGGLVSAFVDKREYKLLTRVQGPLAKCVEFMFALFKLFHWKHMSIIYSDKKGPNSAKRDYYFAAEAIFHGYIKKYNKKPLYVDYVEDNPNHDFAQYLKECSLQARTSCFLFTNS